MSVNASRKPHHVGVNNNERTPLINGSSSPNDDGAEGDNHYPTQSSDTMVFLFNSEHTPGKDSDNVAVRWSAQSWHVTKVTLMSSEYTLRGAIKGERGDHCALTRKGPVNFLLVTVPIGIIAGAMGWNPTAVFVINFFAIMPLAAVLSFATEEISMKLGQTLGGLLNATFGNAVELIVCLTSCL